MAEMGGRPPAGTERAPVTRGIASLTPMSGEPGDYPSHCPLRGYPEFRSNYPTLDEAEMSRHSLRYLEGSVYDSTPIPRFRSSLYSRSRATHDQTSAIYNSPYMLVRDTMLSCAFHAPIGAPTLTRVSQRPPPRSRTLSSTLKAART